MPSVELRGDPGERDIVVSPHNGHSSDSTTISAIFRREADAYDAGFSMFVPAKANGAAPSRPFADALGGGNATFTVGGVTKSLDESWIFDGGTKVLTRFDTVSDANGEITGTFAAADANGGAFNGLSVVGAFPDYQAPQFVITVR